MDHHGDHAAQFRDRFWLSLALTVPVVATTVHVRSPEVRRDGPAIRPVCRRNE
jgi:hypothetical protein